MEIHWGDYSYDENKMRLRINCLGCIYGASVEDYEQCMARTIDYILETKKVSSVVLAKEREYEYDFDQVKMLTEIAGVLEDVIREKVISYKTLSFDKCKEFYSK